MSGGKSKNDGEGLSSWGPTTPQPKSFARRFRWLIVLGAVLVLLLILAALAPTLASTGWGKSIILGKVNNQLNGRLEAKEWSLSWFGGIELREVRLLDKEKRQLAEVKRITTDLSVADVLGGDYYELGKTRVEGLVVNFKRYKDGTTNFTGLAKTQPGAKKPSPSAASSPDVPDLKGDFNVDFRGTLEQQREDGSWET